MYQPRGPPRTGPSGSPYARHLLAGKAGSSRLWRDDGTVGQALELMAKWWRKNIWRGVLMPGETLSQDCVRMPNFATWRLGFRIPHDDNDEKARWLNAELPPDEDPAWAHVSRFFLRPWFTRLWVVQEFVLARRLVSICGQQRVSELDLIGAILYFPGAWILVGRSFIRMSASSR